ncbi:acetyl-Coenzyme A acetyltransferase 1 [Salpingoeca rosetta]|uniref:Acetyl-Coenzyme A acetyltransferase 1 n=1 Tax=Salpingoeca rosetta (strain ATCC 50818 / BSB-021) TaxID=946362 RepID=F2UJ63_SALR5|nr:acetyl-Coenzyme A acetyltransferase 1 [Salpingoeca rosetta]EGD77011.1 acetyl-Coenzyme A acetyltransferase 1 [Salpingoeca rosetta]|eukprot:XP_004990851.1 acetyl-Coenzyme A acetyltransferase 1 [Salpingoeca rosetta]
MLSRLQTRQTTSALRGAVRCASTGLPKDVYICSAARTPIGSINSSLAAVTAPRLGVIAAQGAMERAGLKPEHVEEVYFGNVISAGAGQSPARQVAIGAGCPVSTEATTINKVCASGMKAIMMAAQNITLGVRNVMVAGGMESMSNAPYILRKMRAGAGYGHQTAEDLVLADGLTDAYNNIHMGLCGEDTAEKYNITREQCDEFAIESYKRSSKAAESGVLAKEIVDVNIPQRKGDDKVVSVDEEFTRINFDRIPSLRSVFKKDGVITAANASTLNDGAAAVVLASEEAVAQHGLTPLAKIRGFGDAARAPIEFPIAPALATPIALENAGVSVADISRWEINEAFAVVVLANMKMLNIDASKVNINGGAVSIGHPIGMSGARIVGSLVHHLEKGELGCASICNGGGAASAIVIEKL